MGKSKKTNPKLTKKLIVNKLGHKQTVYVDMTPEAFVPKKGYKKTTVEERSKTGYIVKTKKRKIHSPNVNVEVETRERIGKNKTGVRGVSQRKTKVQPIVKKAIPAEKYDKKSVTYKLVTGKVKYKNEKAMLNEADWKKLVREHEGFIAKTAARYNYGKYNDERYKELKQIGMIGLVEGINKYGKVQDAKNPYDFGSFAFNYVTGRMKEAISKEFRSGIQLPNTLIMPFEDFKKVKDDFVVMNGRKPTTAELARLLQDKWSKKTFARYYKTAEERTYVGVDKSGKPTLIPKKIVDYKYASQFPKTKVKKVLFSALPDEQKKKFLEKDKLPLTGYATVYKEGAIQTKEATHEENLAKIERRFSDLEHRLKLGFEESSIVEPEEYEHRKKLLKTMEDAVTNKKAEYDEANLALRKKMDEFAIDYNRMSDAINELDKKITEEKNKKKKDTYQKQRLLFSEKTNKMIEVSYQNKIFKPFQEKTDKLKNELSQLQNNLDIAKKVYPTSPMSEEDFEQKMANIKKMRKESEAVERKRFNSDRSSSLIPGILDRVKEFENIEALKELRLDIAIDKGRGDDTFSPIETVYVPQLNQQEEEEVREQHKRGKAALIRGIDEYLVPNLQNILKLHLGLHQDSEKSAGDIWGSLSTNKEIVNWFDKRAVDDETVAKKVSSLVKDKKGEGEAAAYLSNVPFLISKYQSNPELIKKEWEEWKAAVPKSSNKIVEEKIKKPIAKYNKEVKDFTSRLKKAKDEYKAWVSKNKKVKLSIKKKKLAYFKDKYNIVEYGNGKGFVRPTKFEIVKRKDIVTKADIQDWKSKKPKFVYTGQDVKETWVGQNLDKARDLVRNIIPIQTVRDLLSAHRKMVEHGLIEKGFVNDFNFIYKIVSNNNIENYII